MKKTLMLPCALLWLTACGGSEAPEPTAPDSSPSSLVSQEAAIGPLYWYTCNLPCPTGYCPTSSVYYPDCIPYGSSTRYTCTPCSGGGDPTPP
ncbi:hypothetical protein JGU66_23940 [Myxococcaceae bacterium JPH2]|nr:hypothetical protein [Myxococcaceae bacterium JPH2]